MKKRKIWIDRTTDRYFSEPICKFVVVARIKENGEWRFERLFFGSREEMEQVQEGAVINY